MDDFIVVRGDGARVFGGRSCKDAQAFREAREAEQELTPFESFSVWRWDRSKSKYRRMSSPAIVEEIWAEANSAF